MIGKRFCTVRYAGEGEGGLTEKTRAWGDVCAQNWTDIKRKGATKAKMYENFKKTEVLANTHVRSLKLKGHLSGSCQNSHNAEYTARSWEN